MRTTKMAGNWRQSTGCTALAAATVLTLWTVGHRQPALADNHVVQSTVKRQVVTMLVPEVYHVRNGEVALTIDDGPSRYTTRIVDVLNHYHVKATFFFIGSRVKYWPQGVEAAAFSGQGIGDHSETHPDFTRLSLVDQRWQVFAAARDIQAYTAQPITLFRPPYGDFNEDTERVLQSDHVALALWNDDPRDWSAKTPEQVVSQVFRTNPSGKVYDLHDTRQTWEALPKIIELLEQRRLTIVLLEAPSTMQGIDAPNNPRQRFKMAAY